MFIVSHPTGNEFVRAILEGLRDREMLASFHTTLSCKDSDFLIRVSPPAFREQLLRRQFDLPKGKIVTYPYRELVRSAARRLNLPWLTRHEIGWASADAVYQALDAGVARYMARGACDALRSAAGVYCFEDGALRTFQQARDLDLLRVYDLPIPYWSYSRALLQEEAARYPAWAATLEGARDSEAKLVRKTEEIELADVVVLNSKFTYASLPDFVRQGKVCIISLYGCRKVDSPRPARAADHPLRVLFVGMMTQRKGLADVFQAMKMLKRSDVELIVLGTPVVDLSFYRSQYDAFTPEQPRSHRRVLEFMQGCDLLVLPSLVEGRGMVQAEAMACGLPVVATENAASADLIEEGQTGFLIPIRRPDQLAEKIGWFADNRAELEAMSERARQKVAGLSWDGYRQTILDVIVPMALKGK